MYFCDMRLLYTIYSKIQVNIELKFILINFYTLMEELATFYTSILCVMTIFSLPISNHLIRKIPK